MTLCVECHALINYLHSRTRGQSHSHKNVIDVLRAAPNCDLCNLVVSVQFKWQDNEEPETSTLSLYNNENNLKVLESHLEEDAEMFPAIKVEALEDICTRNSEVVLEVRFANDRMMRIYLAVWKETPCANVESECERHKQDFVSDHFFNSNPAENRYAQFSSCSTSDIAYRPQGMITHEESTATLDSVKSWLHVCEHGPEHGPCQKSFAGDLIDGFEYAETEAQLPRRLLDIENDRVRLVETQPGDTGAYIALSHCWGRPENHPPKTTRANYDDHLRGVELSTLPKTFRDAIKVARHLSVRYIWIDSFCIIQDDDDDWNREAANMGAVYEYARLTIAAAGARDCTEGCFVTARQALDQVHEAVLQLTEGEDKQDGGLNKDHAPRSSPPEKPYISVLSKGTNGLPITINIGAVPVWFYEPYYSALGYRAWARQEWYLSRRMIFFTRGGLSWKCRVGQWNERERYYKMREASDNSSTPDWAQLLQRYSDDVLTYESDRLVALQGISTQTASMIEGTYHFGLWTDQPELLFWMMKEPPRDIKGPEAPSWSWASRNGSKFFWKTMIQFALGHGQKDLTWNGIDIDEMGKLTTTAPICELYTASVSDEWIDAGFVPKECNMVPESALILYAYGSTPLLFLSESDTSQARTIGLATLDDHSAIKPRPVFGLFILATPRLLEVQPTPKVQVNSGEILEADRYASEGETEYVFYEPLGPELYWILLVQEIPDVPDTYRRIGMGLVNPSVVDLSIDYKKIHLV